MVNDCCWSVVQSRVNLCNPINCSAPGLLVLYSLLEFTQIHAIESVMASNRIILHHPLLLPSIFPSIGSFLMSWLFTSSGQSIGASASASVLPVNTQGWFPLGFTGLISLQSEELSRVFSDSTFWKHQFFGAQSYLWSSFHVHICLLEKSYIWLDGTLPAKKKKKKFLLFDTLSKVVIVFLPRSKHLLISWMQSPSTVIVEPKKIKSVTVSIVSPSITMSDGSRCHDLGFSSQLFHSPLSSSSRGSLVPLPFLPLWWCHLHIWAYWYSPGNLVSSF